MLRAAIGSHHNRTMQAELDASWMGIALHLAPLPQQGRGRLRTSAAVRTSPDLPRLPVSERRRSSSASGDAARPARSSRASASMCAGAKLPSSLHSALRRCHSGSWSSPSRMLVRTPPRMGGPTKLIGPSARSGGLLACRPVGSG